MTRIARLAEALIMAMSRGMFASPWFYGFGFGLRIHGPVPGSLPRHGGPRSEADR
jgi:hypothetical protein